MTAILLAVLFETEFLLMRLKIKQELAEIHNSTLNTAILLATLALFLMNASISD